MKRLMIILYHMVLGCLYYWHSYFDVIWYFWYADQYFIAMLISTRKVSECICRELWYLLWCPWPIVSPFIKLEESDTRCVLFCKSLYFSVNNDAQTSTTTTNRNRLYTNRMIVLFVYQSRYCESCKSYPSVLNLLLNPA